MLTTKTVPPTAKDYYKEDNYYSKEDSEVQSQWQGKGAEKLGLSGQVNDEVFGLLLHGRLPDKTKFRRRPPTQADYKERGALDLTFSAPKSVSLLTKIGGDKELEQAHYRAVAKAIDYIEKHHAMTRIRQRGNRLKVNTGNLVVAKFNHDTSRQLDPQLHTHCLVLNMTQTSSGKWYSLSDDDIHKNKRMLGIIYQNELARGAMELGYQIHRNGNGTFDIAGFKQEHLDYFSKRAKEIEPLLDKFSTWQERQDASLKVREKKVEIDRRELLDYWATEAASIGLQLPRPDGRQAVVVGNHSSQSETINERAAARAERHPSAPVREAGEYRQTTERATASLDHRPAADARETEHHRATVERDATGASHLQQSGGLVHGGAVDSSQRRAEGQRPGPDHQTVHRSTEPQHSDSGRSGPADGSVRFDGERQPVRDGVESELAGEIAELLNNRQQQQSLSAAIAQLKAAQQLQSQVQSRHLQLGTAIADATQVLKTLQLKTNPSKYLARETAKALQRYKAQRAVETSISTDVLNQLKDAIGQQQELSNNLQPVANTLQTLKDKAVARRLAKAIAKRRQQAALKREAQVSELVDAVKQRVEAQDKQYRQFMGQFETALQTVTDRFTARRVALAVARKQSHQQMMQEGIQETLSESMQGIRASSQHSADTLTTLSRLGPKIQQIGKVLEEKRKDSVEQKRAIAYDQPHSIFASVDEAVAAGIEHASERAVAFRPERIVDFVLEELGGFDIDSIEAAIERAPGLIRFGKFVTTDNAVRRELDTIRTVMEQQEQLPPIAPTAQLVELQLRATAREQQQANPHWQWTSGQSDAVRLAASTRDRFVAWQGVAGAGKTTALQQVSKLANSAGYSVKAFAPTAKAAKVLSEELGIQGQTVARLVRREPKPIAKPQLWIVDEAGMLSADAGQKIVHQAVQANARVVFVGDTRQLSAVEAGNPFKSLQQAGMRTAYLEISRRQKNPGLKSAVDLAARGEIESSVQELERNGMTHYHKYRGSRHKQIVADYLALTPAERMNTLVIAGTNKDREAIAAGIRAGLRARGELGEKVAATRLGAKNLTDAQKKFVHNYEVGDVIIPTSKAYGLEAWQRYQVTGIDDDRLRVTGDDGIYRVVKPSSKLSVFYEKPINVSVGDVMRWRRNDMKAGRRNGQEFSIEAIEGRMATVQSKTGRVRQVNLDEAQHFDYGIVTTTYGSQGKTCGRVLMMAEDDGTLNRESYYVGISRAKHGVKVYAEQRSVLVEAANRSQANENPIEQVENWVETLNGLLEKSVERERQMQAHEFVPATETIYETETVAVEPVETTERDRPVESAVHLTDKHRYEMEEESAIAPDVVELNVRSVAGEEAKQVLLTSPELYTSSGQLKKWVQQRYDHIEKGGWVFQGVDPLNDGERMDWVRFKPDRPKMNQKEDVETGEIKTKPIKYESTPKTATRAMFPAYPRRLWEAMASSNKQPIESRDRHFWQWVERTNLPIVITEGSKKGMALASAGYIAIALPGVWNGARKATDDLPERLIPELEKFATAGRQIYFAFDADTKQLTVEQVNKAIHRTAGLMAKKDCHVFVMSWEGEKGIDDLIAAKGTGAVKAAYQQAQPFTEWKLANGFQTKQQEGIDIELVQHWPQAARIAGRSARYVEGTRRAVAGVESGGYLGEHNRQLLYVDVSAAMRRISRQILVPRIKREWEEARYGLKLGHLPPTTMLQILQNYSASKGRRI
ncbi:MAG: MobF family relaxase [Cyanobacteria bacterium P01_G01_bin.4]